MRSDKLVTIASDDHWEVLRTRKATTVIDPMVVRVADLFSRGQSGGTAEAWGVIKHNVDGLATFVDALILEPGIPIFDYWYTGEGWGRDLSLFDYTDPVVVPVGVDLSIWSPLAAEVAVAMGKKPPLPESAAAETAANLRYIRWGFIAKEFGGDDGSIGDTAGDPTGDALVNSYLYVALLFARYAAKLGNRDRPGTQILSPGQARMFVATAAAELSGAPRPLHDTALFGELENIINQSRHGYERTWRSDRLHFLPHLLSLEDRKGTERIRTPEQLFREALAWRYRRDVSDYRERLNRAEVTLEGGRDDDRWSKDLKRARDQVQAALNVKSSTVNLTVQVPAGVGVGVTADTSKLRSWLVSQWPGTRYRRLLPKLAKAHAAAKQIDRHLEAIWKRG